MLLLKPKGVWGCESQYTFSFQLSSLVVQKPIHQEHIFNLLSFPFKVNFSYILLFPNIDHYKRNLVERNLLLVLSCVPQILLFMVVHLLQN